MSTSTTSSNLAAWLNLISCLFGLMFIVVNLNQILLDWNLFLDRRAVTFIASLSMSMYSISSGAIAYLFLKSDVSAIYKDSTLFVSNNITIIEMSWRLGQMLLYWLFLKRLQQSFKNTKYESSQSIYCLFYLSII